MKKGWARGEIKWHKRMVTSSPRQFNNIWRAATCEYYSHKALFNNRFALRLTGSHQSPISPSNQFGMMCRSIELSQLQPKARGIWFGKEESAVSPTMTKYFGFSLHVLFLCKIWINWVGVPQKMCTSFTINAYVTLLTKYYSCPHKLSSGSSLFNLYFGISWMKFTFLPCFSFTGGLF